MMRPLLIATLLLALAVPTLADEQYKSSIAPEDGSPVKLSTCEVWARDFIQHSGLIGRSTVPNALIDVGVQFTNISAKTIKDVRFAFVAYDAFNSRVSSVLLDTSQDVSADTVSMVPGAVVDLLGPRGWKLGNNRRPKDHVICSVEKVAFDDGSTWATPSPAPTASQAPPP